MKLWRAVALLSMLPIATLAVAAPSALSNNWTDHTGGYVTGGLGVNLVKVSFDGDSVDGGAGISGALQIGYNFHPRVAAFAGVGYYFSGLVWGVDAGVRGNLPVSQKISLTADIGGAYLVAPATVSAAGPMVGVGTAFAMSPQVDFNLNVNDVILSKDEVTGNIVSVLAGLTYHFNG